MPFSDLAPVKSVEQQWEEYVDSFDEPIKEKSWARSGLWRLVGNGEITDASCGSFKGFIGCVNDEGHSQKDLKGNVYAGLALVRIKHKSCDSYNCPVCYLTWAVKAAHRMTDKLEQLGVKYGIADHIVLSLPEQSFSPEEGLAEYFSANNKEFDKLLKKAVKALNNRGIVGGAMIFHGFRYADHKEAEAKGVPFGWRWSPHFHILGFIRNKKQFYKVVPQEFLKDGYVVNLKDKRQSVFGTAWYQLNHASIQFQKEHFEVARWFGDVTDPKSKLMRENSRKIKMMKDDSSTEAIKETLRLKNENNEIKSAQKQRKKDNEKRHRQKCPICNKELTKLTYYGMRKDLQRTLTECRKERLKDLRYWEKSKTVFLDKIIDAENGIVNWAEA